jgi:hypothetical protein
MFAENSGAVLDRSAQRPAAFRRASEDELTHDEVMLGRFFVDPITDHLHFFAREGYRFTGSNPSGFDDILCPSEHEPKVIPLNPGAKAVPMCAHLSATMKMISWDQGMERLQDLTAGFSNVILKAFGREQADVVGLLFGAHQEKVANGLATPLRKGVMTPQAAKPISQLAR